MNSLQRRQYAASSDTSVVWTPWALQRFSYQTSLPWIWILVGTSVRQVSHSDWVWPQKIYGRDLRNGRVMVRPRNGSRQQHDGGIQQNDERQQMKQGQWTDQRAIRLEKFPGKSLHPVERQHEIEAVGDHESIAPLHGDKIDN